MEYTQNLNINQAVYEFLKGEPINEAFHEKDRGAVKEIGAKSAHHHQMINRHMNAMNAGGNKDKELNKHDLAIMAHSFASKFYNNLTNYDHNGFGGAQPVADYHNDKEFYDKMGDMATKRANGKSKECGVSCDTESK